MVAGKGIGTEGCDLEFRPAGFADMKPLADTGDGENAARSQLV